MTDPNEPIERPGASGPLHEGAEPDDTTTEREETEQAEQAEQAEQEGQVSEVSAMPDAGDASVSDGDNVHGQPTQESGDYDTGPAGPDADPHPGARDT